MGKGDVEAGFSGQGNSQSLYPSMTESPEIRWGFIRKVYSIIAIQLLLTVAVGCVFMFFPPARDFVRTNSGNPYRFIVLIVALVVSIILLLVLSRCYRKHPVNLFLLGLYTLCMSVSVGYACAMSKGMVVIEAAFLTGVVVLSLTLYTFWAVKRGSDFSFLGPFLFASLMVMLLFGVIQMFLPFGPMGRMVFAAVGALLMCGFIVYDTNEIIKTYDYDEYIWAAISIYGDIINLFIYLLSFFNEL